MIDAGVRGRFAKNWIISVCCERHQLVAKQYIPQHLLLSFGSIIVLGDQILIKISCENEIVRWEVFPKPAPILAVSIKCFQKSVPIERCVSLPFVANPRQDNCTDYD